MLDFDAFSRMLVYTNMEVLTMLQPVVVAKSPRYREAAYEAIKEAILSGKLPATDALTEEGLAAQLKISRTPVREALALLEHEQLIAPKGRGLFVKQITRDEFIEMFVANEQIEPYLARRAALAATEQQLATLHEAIAQARASACEGQVDFARFLRASRNFHRTVGEAAGNSVLTNLVVRNEERADMYLLNAGKQPNVVSMCASNDEHAAILEAIEHGDPDTAARLVIYHAQSLRLRFGTLFTQGN
jgi:DNA-binding GntR family transcriptional regulator